MLGAGKRGLGKWVVPELCGGGAAGRQARENYGGGAPRVRLGKVSGGSCGPGWGLPSHTHPRASGLGKEETTQGGEPPCGYQHTRQAGTHTHRYNCPPPGRHARTRPRRAHSCTRCTRACMGMRARIHMPTVHPHPHTRTLHTCIETRTPAAPQPPCHLLLRSHASDFPAEGSSWHRGSHPQRGSKSQCPGVGGGQRDTLYIFT